MRAILAAFLACAAAGSAYAQDVDPVTRTRDGVVECFGPNIVARTCEVISSFRVLDDGQILADGVVHIQNNPAIVLYATSRLSVRDGMLCERVERATIEAARITVDGRAAEPAIERQIKDIFWNNVGAFGELCTRYTADGAGATVTFFADGVERPEMANRVIWIRPEDGYTLGAPDALRT
jgi:hypothetical protein